MAGELERAVRPRDRKREVESRAKREPVERAMAEGKVVILEIDVQGGLQVKAAMPQAMMIFILPPQAAK